MTVFFFAIAAAVMLFFGILLVRAACFRPGKKAVAESAPIDMDRSRAVSALQELVRCKTVSYSDHALEEDSEFEKLISLLPRLYPSVFQACEFLRFPERGLLLKWTGKAHHTPVVLMAHYDVVPAEESQWDKPAFEAIIENGVLWGRGTLDTKVTVNGILCAAEHLISTGFRPENDCYFAFSGSEEINGNGAKHIVDYFIEQGITPALVLDEGGAVVENVFPGVKSPCALIGIGEKGMMNVEYSVTSHGGHASAPPVETPVSILSHACLKVLSHPFQMRINAPAAQLFDTLGRHSTFFYRIVFSNLWCFRPVLDLICKKTGGELNALVRTTVAFTQMEGSSARNVIPPEAKMVANMRLNPHDTVASALAYLKKTVKDDSVEITALESFNPSPISETDCPAWDKVASAVASTWRGCIVAPYLMVQCSDSRHYGRISNHVYRFSAMDMTAEERATIHGNNERIRVESVAKAVEFYIRLMKQC